MLTGEAVTHAVARYVQQLFQAALVNVTYQPAGQSSRIVASEPQNGKGEGKPDRLLPILNAWGLVGEIQIWRGDYLELPAEDGSAAAEFRGADRQGAGTRKPDRGQVGLASTRQQGKRQEMRLACSSN